jgi:hypothetical protein
LEADFAMHLLLNSTLLVFVHGACELDQINKRQQRCTNPTNMI